uniref:TMEM87A/B GOLD domain-containing protein n=1 Tax=Capitella teleta TaxID=283909 RepID=X2AIS6_CAPTE
MATLAGIGGVLCILAFISAFNGAECITEQGIWNVNMTQSKTLAAFSKSMYNNTVISVSISCDEDLEYELGISWILRRSPCAEEYISLEKNPNITQYYSDSPGKDFFNYGYKTVTYQQSDVYGGKCHAHNIIQLPIDNWEQYTIDVTTLKPYVPKEEKQVKQNDKETDKSKDKDVEEETDKKEEETDEKVEESKEGGKKTRSRRDEEEALKALPTTPVATEKAPAKTPTPASKVTTKKPPPPVTSKEDEEEEKELEEEELEELEEEEGSDEVEFMSNVQLNQDN